MKWTIHASCGNSPKNQMLIDWIQRFVEGDEDYPFIDENSTIQFKKDTYALENFNLPKVLDEIHLDSSITHGRVGAVSGKASSAKETYAFGLFFEFSLGKQPKIKDVNCIIEKK